MKNKALGFYEGRSLDDLEVFTEKEIPIPICQTHDLLVEVQAVSVNPIDTKRRQMTVLSEDFQIQGYDAVGIVKEIGSAVSGFAVGDRVFYAGTTQRLVRIKGFKLLILESQQRHQPAFLTVILLLYH